MNNPSRDKKMRYTRFKKLFNTKEYHIKKIGKGQHCYIKYGKS